MPVSHYFTVFANPGVPTPSWSFELIGELEGGTQPCPYDHNAPLVEYRNGLLVTMLLITYVKGYNAP